MGQLIQKDHPLFKEFPTESHTNWQWWPMANQRAVILPDTVKQPFDAIITEMDSYAFLRPMAQLFECRVREMENFSIPHLDFRICSSILKEKAAS